jgi:hypothetical protein
MRDISCIPSHGVIEHNHFSHFDCLSRIAIATAHPERTVACGRGNFWFTSPDELKI